MRNTRNYKEVPLSQKSLQPNIARFTKYSISKIYNNKGAN
ncbi:hypothetical protein DU19_0077 [Chlamydia muridarum]|uniref:Uncharacterized protein n=1 Tax=Chlamydia muridarum (strain MoPn / Nigg) TaxID=243161 RepID=Q9PLM8_CHLMU|nr:hypothetical protein TC_0071 [Chlamydia muridarum str. Nigg]KDU80101.1 hypothetical protein DU17_0077 [Chlamydia muridarum]KDU81064.1 hypothetical protein DU18_0078 [Chlamydia muridarum]KDU82167.1 hypothetical protein DU19_0077 [Chlamydia muridarum]KDU83016.1 hypothetical protein DU20_0077 [Chlamydia muridarum]